MWTAQRLWLVLGGSGVVAALATLFGPADRWLGIDVGATGASVFLLSLVALMTWLAMKPTEVFPDEWSLPERRGWLGAVLAALVMLTLAKYVWVLSQLSPVPTRIGELPGRQLIYFALLILIAWGICRRLLARGAGPVAEDERDLRVRLAADRAGDWALTIAVVECVVLLASVPAALLERWLNPMVLASLLIALLMARTLIENLSLVTLYARARR